MDHENAFKQWKRHCFSKVDFSKKGNIDDEIYPVVCLINDSSNYFTTSSCSGRIILIDGHSVAVNSGFRNSGMSIGKRGKIIMAVRSTHCLEVPLSHKGEILVNENYIHFLVQAANQKMAENVTRIKRFYDGLQAVLQADGSSSMATCKDKTTKIVQNQHQRKTQDSVIEDSQIPANKFSDSEDYLETSLILFS
ncbi:tRNA wybutosine-synthesizing protein 3 homolog isoform X3 [Alosa sapidissima]|uniref:tRNA wybutosine-synthesizing protein 3 homolog isoform X3 n=1 Tax=Alosa sapidissima TaxID=34773 RepID=UPI001C08627A|nr:tRNA wybutosine-synthesizing protein 3 homolog isoform X3 [Alosa sapidissima]